MAGQLLPTDMIPQFDLITGQNIKEYYGAFGVKLSMNMLQYFAREPIV